MCYSRSRFKDKRKISDQVSLLGLTVGNILWVSEAVCNRIRGQNGSGTSRDDWQEETCKWGECELDNTTDDIQVTWDNSRGDDTETDGEIEDEDEFWIYRIRSFSFPEYLVRMQILNVEPEFGRCDPRNLSSCHPSHIIMDRPVHTISFHTTDTSCNSTDFPHKSGTTQLHKTSVR